MAKLVKQKYFHYLMYNWNKFKLINIKDRQEKQIYQYKNKFVLIENRFTLSHRDIFNSVIFFEIADAKATDIISFEYISLSHMLQNKDYRCIVHINTCNYFSTTVFPNVIKNLNNDYLVIKFLYQCYLSQE